MGMIDMVRDWFAPVRGRNVMPPAIRADFMRGNRGVTLTPFGSALEHHAKSMLAELRRLGDGIDAWKTGGSGRVAVGSLLTASATLLPETIVRLHDTAPDVTVEIGAETKAFRARVAEPGERDPIWTKQKADYPGFAGYEAKTDREIPVVILDPA